MKPQTASPPPPTPAVILFGLDDKDKSHASWFAEPEREPARTAANLMGMVILPVEGKALDDLAMTLPRGKLFDSGKAFVPFVSAKLADQLRGHLPAGTDLKAMRAVASAQAASAATAAANAGKTIGANWSKLVVNDLVLATDGPGDGWWEAFVEAVEGDTLILRWRDWQTEPGFARMRHDVGLLPQPAATKNN